MALGLCAFWYYKQSGVEPIVSGLLVLVSFLVPLVPTSDSSIQTGNPEPDVVSATAAELAPGVTPSSVWSTIDNAPPFQKANVRAQYAGIKVKWPLFLFSAESADGDLVNLVLTGEPSMRAVSCTVELNRYREIAVLPKGTPITVWGEISLVNDMVIRLSKVTLSFA
jgi:hypothetical protein